MSREIKFRVWGKKLGGWVDWDDFAITCVCPRHNYEGGQYMISKAPDGQLDCYYPDSEDEYTVQQFTGLKDKNGKEIYEGDIIKFSEHKGYTYPSFTAEVVFDDKRACFGFREHILIESFAVFHELEYDFLPYTEVVGNIFENKELLQKKTTESRRELALKL